MPYFKHIFDIAIAYLSPAAPSSSLPKKADGSQKKKRKTADAHSLEDSVASWQLRFLIIHAFHKSFLHDSDGAFLDAARFQVCPLNSFFE